jgi:hypothetical protein
LIFPGLPAALQRLTGLCLGGRIGLRVRVCIGAATGHESVIH